MLFSKAALGVVLESPGFGQRLITFCIAAARVIGEQDEDALRRTPESIVMSLADALRFCAATHPSLFITAAQPDLDAIFAFLFKFASDSDTVSNPYTRAHFVKTLYGFVPAGGDASPGGDQSPLGGQGAGREKLSGALMKFFVDIELTGASDAFYTKYRHRFHVATILDYLWSCHDGAMHVQSVVDLSKGGTSREVIRFFSMAFNDMIDCLNQGLEAIEEVHKIEVEQQRAAEAAGGSESPIEAFIRQTEDSNRLDQLERQCVFVLDYLLLLFSILDHITTSAPEVITHHLLATRTAELLGVVLERLAGDSCGDLKVSQPRRYHFEPRRLMRTCSHTLSNLAGDPGFVQACAAEPRLSEKTLRRTWTLLTRRKILPQDACAAFERAAYAIRDASLVLEDDDALLDDADQEFIDPIMQTVMQDPVLLTTSGVIAERGSIIRHLLSDPHDPFNRAPLTEDLLEPVPALKARIDAYRLSKKSIPAPAAASPGDEEGGGGGGRRGKGRGRCWGCSWGGGRGFLQGESDERGVIRRHHV